MCFKNKSPLEKLIQLHISLLQTSFFILNKYIIISYISHIESRYKNLKYCL